MLVKTTVSIHETSYILSILPKRLIDTEFNKNVTLCITTFLTMIREAYAEFRYAMCRFFYCDVSC